MKKYECRNWSMNDIAHAMKGVDSQGRHIVVPIFQRGKRWNEEKRKKFIDSLLKGYPVGTLLFAEYGDKKYSVIDGLQRSSTICEYILYPTRRENLNNVSQEVLDVCRKTLYPDSQNVTINQSINEAILTSISSFKSFDDIEVSEIADRIYDKFPTIGSDFRSIEKQLKDIIRPWYQNYKQDFESIKQTEIPVIIYTGDNEYLSDIFRRINEEGQPLNDFEIYAATWNSSKYSINNIDIVDSVIK